ncbi:MAG: hypothetical protein IT234_03615 [Bacteroidia bacterium]|nr:hypothetical protein [Bacteroidia bacterium]
MTAYKKGLEFEKEVAEYLKTELKFDDVVVRPRVSGKYSDRGYEIDVLAKEIDNRGKMIGSWSVKLYLIGALIILITAFDYFLEWNVLGWQFIFVGLTPILGSLIYVMLSNSKNMNDTYVWVECKNLKTKTKRGVVSDLIHRHDDYNLQKEKKWNINRLMIFSASGFDHDSKLLAERHNIVLYEKNDKNEFIKTKLNF